MLKKILSLTLILAMLVTSTLSFANGSSQMATASTLSASDEKVLVQEIYSSLNDEAKALFNAQIAKDPTLTKVHKKYVGNVVSVNYNVNALNSNSVQTYRAAKSSQNALDVLKTELTALALSSALYYALMAEGAALVAAGIDGPIPVGDVAGLVVGGIGAIVIAFHAQEFINKYAGISRAFSIAFSVAAVQIKQGLDQVYRNCVNALSAVSVSGQTVTANGVKYQCKTRADQLTENQKRLYKYYPALLYNGSVYVDTTRGMDTSVAKTIMVLNDGRFGVWATSASYARGLCGGNNAIWDNSHNSSEGYFYHYHHPSTTYLK